MAKSYRKKVPFKVYIPNLAGDGIAKTVKINIEVTTECGVPGEQSLTLEAHRLIDDTKAIHMGMLLPEELKKLRKNKLKLSIEEMAKLLQVGTELYHKWESRRAWPSRTISVLLHALRDGVVTVEYLRSLNTVRRDRIAQLGAAQPK